MEINKKKSNPKALKIEGLENMKRKVGTGFKCNPHLKLELIKAAQGLDITLSEYLETLMHQSQKDLKLGEQVERLNAQVSFYENAKLLEFFNHYKGQTIKGIEIKEPKDIFTVLVNSFKIKE